MSKRKEAAAAGSDSVPKLLRVSYSDDRVVECICRGESLMGGVQGVGQSWLLGTISWVLLSILFAVRASTLGAMQPPDIYVCSGRLCMGFRHLKWWIAGRQRKTGQICSAPQPLKREGRHGIPFDSSGHSWRDRAIWVILSAAQQQCLLLLTAKGSEGAADLFNSQLESFGLMNVGADEVNTSHSGRKTCIVVASALGASMEVLREWMLVLDQHPPRLLKKGKRVIGWIWIGDYEWKQLDNCGILWFSKGARGAKSSNLGKLLGLG